MSEQLQNNFLDILYKNSGPDLNEKINSLYQFVDNLVTIIAQLPESIDLMLNKVYDSINDLENRINYCYQEIDKLKDDKPLINEPVIISSPPKINTVKPQPSPQDIRGAIMDELKILLKKRNQGQE